MGGTSVEAPPQRSYGQETTQALRAQLRLAPQLYAAEAQYRPQYTNLELDQLNTLMNGGAGRTGLLGLYQNSIAPALSATEAQAMSTQRAGDIADVEALGGRATRAMLNSDPNNAALVNELNRQAQSELALGGSLAPEQIRQMQQASRAGFAARGLNGTNASVADEVIRQYQLSNQEQDRRRAFAAGIVGLNKSVTGDPFQQILGRTGQAFNTMTNVGNQGYGMTSNIGARLFNPESQYKADIMNQNYQGLLSANTASASNRTAMSGAIMGALGSAASSASAL